MFDWVLNTLQSLVVAGNLNNLLNLPVFQHINQFQVNASFLHPLKHQKNF